MCLRNIACLSEDCKPSEGRHLLYPFSSASSGLPSPAPTRRTNRLCSRFPSPGPTTALLPEDPAGSFCGTDLCKCAVCSGQAARVRGTGLATEPCSLAVQLHVAPEGDPKLVTHSIPPALPDPQPLSLVPGSGRDFFEVCSRNGAKVGHPLPLALCLLLPLAASTPPPNKGAQWAGRRVGDGRLLEGADALDSALGQGAGLEPSPGSRGRQGPSFRQTWAMLITVFMYARSGRCHPGQTHALGQPPALASPAGGGIFPPASAAPSPREVPALPCQPLLCPRHPASPQASPSTPGVGSMCLETWDSVHHLPEPVLGQGCLARVLQLTQHALHAGSWSLALRTGGPGAKVQHVPGPLLVLVQLEGESLDLSWEIELQGRSPPASSQSSL